jgi:hypothetical protein
MDINIFIQSLTISISRIGTMTEGISEEQARWKPEQKSWSILEVVNHLYDEECNDFRIRLDLTLHHPEKHWPAIDPEGWVSLHHYNQKDFAESVTRLKKERDKSIQWLKELSSPDLQRYYTHPKIGKLTAGDLLAAWAAHDYLHIRQLAQLQVNYLNMLAKPFSIRYASP